MAESKGICPVCNENVSIRRDGKVRHHGYQKGTDKQVSCPGAGQEPRMASDGAFSPTCDHLSDSDGDCLKQTMAIVWTGTKWLSMCATHARKALR